MRGWQGVWAAFGKKRGDGIISKGAAGGTLLLFWLIKQVHTTMLLVVARVQGLRSILLPPRSILATALHPSVQGSPVGALRPNAVLPLWTRSKSAIHRSRTRAPPQHSMESSLIARFSAAVQLQGPVSEFVV